MTALPGPPLSSQIAIAVEEFKENGLNKFIGLPTLEKWLAYADERDKACAEMQSLLNRSVQQLELFDSANAQELANEIKEWRI